MKLLNRILCQLFGHRYRIKRKITPSIREVICTRCKAEFAMDDRAETLLPLDDEFRAMHDTLLDLHQQRMDVYREAGS